MIGTTTVTESSAIPTGDRSAEIAELRGMLAVACSLIEIEASDHQHGHETTRLQRRDIAETLFGFTAKVRSYLKGDE